MTLRESLIAFAMTSVPVGGAGQSAPMASELESGTDALLQAVSAVDASVVWVSGHEGAVLRSVDGGMTWSLRPVQTLDSLQFRDVHAFDAQMAFDACNWVNDDAGHQSLPPSPISVS